MIIIKPHLNIYHNDCLELYLLITGLNLKSLLNVIIIICYYNLLNFLYYYNIELYIILY